MKAVKQKLTLDQPAIYKSKCRDTLTRVGQAGPEG